MIFVEKYRPKKFEDVINLPSELPKMMGNLPHLLFVGKPGTGKTTTAKIIIKVLDAENLILNASDERGINTIREKVKTFAMTKSNNNNHKIVLLDEFDFLTSESMNSLRNLMETYHNNCRFICTANYENKIIDALKSRLTIFRFEQPNQEAIVCYLEKIVKLENLNISNEILKKIVEVNKSDIRKSINTLQRVSSIENLTPDKIKEDDILSEKVFELLKARNFIEARQLVLNSNIEYEHFLNDFHDLVMDMFLNKKLLTSQQTFLIIEALANAMVNVNQVISKEIIVEAFLMKTIYALK